MSRKGLRVAVIIYAISTVLFIGVLIAMSKISIDGVFQIKGTVSEISGGVKLEFDALESDFYGVNCGEQVKVAIEGEQEKYEGIVISKEKIGNIKLKSENIYHYSIRVNEVKNSEHLIGNTNYIVTTDDKTTLVELLYSNSVK